METIKEKVSDIYEIKKSKFISFACPVFSQDDVKKVLDDVRKQHKDARHVCYAYKLSSPNLEKCSDDGEPDGTAGKPLLELIKKRNLNNLLLIVVRYFGGIKLGAGGLLRAYSHAGVLVCDKCEMVEIKDYKFFKLIVPTSQAKNVLSLLNQLNICVENIIYLDNANIFVKLEEKDIKILDNLGVNYEEITNGTN